MKYSLVIFCFLSLTLFLCLPCFAQDSFTLSVSCSIPAVAGVNAPLETSAEEAPEEQIVEENNEAKEETIYLTQVDRTEEGIYYTTYSR